MDERGRTEQNQKLDVLKRAWLTAMSGAFLNWKEVEQRLVDKGYGDAPRWLSDISVRTKLDELCERARSAAATAPAGGKHAT